MTSVSLPMMRLLSWGQLCQSAARAVHVQALNTGGTVTGFCRHPVPSIDLLVEFPNEEVQQLRISCHLRKI